MGDDSMTPNKKFRRYRLLIIVLMLIAVLSLFSSPVIGLFGALLGSAIWLIAGILFFVPQCPRCRSKLMLQFSKMGFARMSFAQKDACPTCQLDLDQPYSPSST
jgi:hypothetical protein